MTSAIVIAIDVVPLIVTVTLVMLPAFGTYQISSSAWPFTTPVALFHTLAGDELSVIPVTVTDGLLRVLMVSTRRSPLPVCVDVVAFNVVPPVLPELAAPKLRTTLRDAVLATIAKFCVGSSARADRDHDGLRFVSRRGHRDAVAALGDVAQKVRAIDVRGSWARRMTARCR